MAKMIFSYTTKTKWIDYPYSRNWTRGEKVSGYNMSYVGCYRSKSWSSAFSWYSAPRILFLNSVFRWR